MQCPGQREGGFGLVGPAGIGQARILFREGAPLVSDATSSATAGLSTVHPALRTTERTCGSVASAAPPTWPNTAGPPLAKNMSTVDASLQASRRG